MSFDAAVQPYFLTNDLDRTRVAPERLKARQGMLASLVKRLRAAVKQETGGEEIGAEREGKCVSHISVSEGAIVDHLKEYSAGLEGNDLELVYAEKQQTRFNQIAFFPGSGIYLPAYFFFPLRVQTEGLRNPVWVGSAPRLLEELAIVNKGLRMDPAVVDKLPAFLAAGEEDLEDYQTELSGDIWWAQMCFTFLHRLARSSVDAKLPVLVNLDEMV